MNEQTIEPSRPRVPMAGLVLVGIWLALHAYFLYRAIDAGAPAYHLGRVCGQAIGPIFFSYLTSFAVFRLGSRRQRSASIAFVVMFVLSVIGSISQAAKRADEHRRGSVAVERTE